jgi:hypothetical protein
MSQPPGFRFSGGTTGLFDLSVDRFGVRDSRERQVSKHSGHEGRPSKSTIGESPMFFEQASQVKHFLCQYLPAAETKPPSVLRMVTGLAQFGQMPFDPPLTMKHWRHKKRGSSEADNKGSGYMVASGRNGVAQAAQECVARDSLGCNTDP